MTQAISQSATTLTQSNGVSEWIELEFNDSVKRCAHRQAKGMTREGQLLNRSKLISMVCSDYRCHFASIYGKTERLPQEVFSLVETAVDAFINSKLAEVNASNVISYRRSFFHKANQCEVVERVATVAENKLTLKEQHLGINLAIGIAEKRLTDQQAKKQVDYDKEAKLKVTIARLELTRAMIEGEQANQAKLMA